MKKLICILLFMAVISCDDFLEKDISSEELTVIFPGNNAIVNDSEIMFSWNLLSGADYYRFILSSEDAASTRGLIADTLVYPDSAQIHLSSKIKLEDGKYQWKLIGINSGYQSKERLISFTVSAVPDISESEISINNPLDGAKLKSSSVDFSWEKLTGAIDYRLRIRKLEPDGMNRIVADTLLNDTRFMTNLEHGNYQWEICGNNALYSTKTKTSEFSVSLHEDISDQTIKILAPNDEAVINSNDISIMWELLSGAAEYKIRICSPAFDNIQTVPVDTLVTGGYFKGKLEDGQYEWQIKAINEMYSTEYQTYSFNVTTVPDISNEIVEVIAPQNGITVNTETVSFSWEQLSGADQYRIIIAYPSFANVQQIVVDEIVETCTYSTDLGEGEYQWKIQGINSKYTSQYSTNSFTVKSLNDLSNKTVTIISPVQNSVLSNENVTFAWERLQGAEKYRLMVASPSFSSIEWLAKDIEVTGTSEVIMLPDGNYEWRIIGMNENSQSRPVSYSFKVNTGDNITNLYPEIIFPSNGSVISAGEIILLWSHMEGAESYNLTLVSPSFENIRNLLLNTNTSATSYTITLPAGNYQLKVQGVNNLHKSKEKIISFSVSE